MALACMKPGFSKRLILLGLLLLVVLIFVFISLFHDAIGLNKKLSEAEIRTIIEKYPNEEIQAETDSLLAHYGDNKQTFLYEWTNPVEVQTLTNMADTLGGLLIGINRKDTYMNEPGYVYIRFNGHRNVQFLMIFKADEDLSTVKVRYKHIIRAPARHFQF